MKEVFLLNKNTRALAASILRFVFSAINRGSHDATFDLTRVGVCTCVIFMNLGTRTKPLTPDLLGPVSWPPAYLLEI